MTREGRTSEDDALAKRAKAGDASARTQLLTQCADRIQGWMHHTLDRRLQTCADDSDAAQEGLLAAYEELPRFRDTGPGSFGAWLRQVARSSLMAAVRELLCQEKRDVQADRKPGETHGSSATPTDGEPAHAAAAPRARREWPTQMLHALPPDCADIVRLVFLDHLRVAAAAAQMGHTEAQGRVLLYRALAELTAIARRRGAGPREEPHGTPV